MDRFEDFRIITKQVALYYSISEREIMAKTRIAKVVRPRQMAFYVISKMIRSASSAGIASFFGKDHVTILHGIKKIKNEIEIYPEVKKEYQNLYRVVRSSLDSLITYSSAKDKGYCKPCIYKLKTEML